MSEERPRKIRVAFPTKSGKGLEDALSEVFGRAEYFTIVDLVNGSIDEVEVVKNPVISYKHGVGPIVAKMLIDMGVKFVGAGELGPGVSELLEQNNVKSFRIQEGIMVKDAVEILLKKLVEGAQ